MVDKWNAYFLRLAREISTRSKDPSTKVGAIIVRPDRSIVSTGYNGFPRLMPDLPLWYEDRERKYQRIIHAEMNALIQAKQSVEGCTLYTWPFMCCDRCIVHLAQAGIIKFIYPSAQPDAQIRWNENFERALLFMDYMHLSSLEILREEIE